LSAGKAVSFGSVQTGGYYPQIRWAVKARDEFALQRDDMIHIVLDSIEGCEQVRKTVEAFNLFGVRPIRCALQFRSASFSGVCVDRRVVSVVLLSLWSSERGAAPERRPGQRAGSFRFCPYGELLLKQPQAAATDLGNGIFNGIDRGQQGGFCVFG
jgi:hypothetical protein